MESQNKPTPASNSLVMDRILVSNKSKVKTKGML